ncbi:MAG TPA: hypothetical protein VH280_12650 [Verrucomicrobiae bacterium]|nr:hypothetical protein [Verrucomicrobiae bacterium]
MKRLFLYLFLGVLTEAFFGPFCYYFGAINPDGGGNLLGLICMLVHFPIDLLGTDYQLTASQEVALAFVTYPFIWAGLWFLGIWFFKRFKRNRQNLSAG